MSTVGITAMITPDLLRDMYGTDVHYHFPDHADDR